MDSFRRTISLATVLLLAQQASGIWSEDKAVTGFDWNAMLKGPGVENGICGMAVIRAELFIFFRAFAYTKIPADTIGMSQEHKVEMKIHMPRVYNLSRFTDLVQALGCDAKNPKYVQAMAISAFTNEEDFNEALLGVYCKRRKNSRDAIEVTQFRATDLSMRGSHILTFYFSHLVPFTRVILPNSAHIISHVHRYNKTILLISPQSEDRTPIPPILDQKTDMYSFAVSLESSNQRILVFMKNSKKAMLCYLDEERSHAVNQRDFFQMNCYNDFHEFSFTELFFETPDDPYYTWTPPYLPPDKHGKRRTRKTVKPGDKPEYYDLPDEIEGKNKLTTWLRKNLFLVLALLFCCFFLFFGFCFMCALVPAAGGGKERRYKRFLHRKR